MFVRVSLILVLLNAPNLIVKTMNNGMHFNHKNPISGCTILQQISDQENL